MAYRERQCRSKPHCRLTYLFALFSQRSYTSDERNIYLSAILYQCNLPIDVINTLQKLEKLSYTVEAIGNCLMSQYMRSCKRVFRHAQHLNDLKHRQKSYGHQQGDGSVRNSTNYFKSFCLSSILLSRLCYLNNLLVAFQV